MSLGASGKLGKVLVFFGWKGIDVAREYVVPANPKSSGQVTQRGYLTDCVAAIHAAQSVADHPFGALDQTSQALKGSLFPTPRTWFNTIIKTWLDQRAAGLRSVIYHGGEVVEGNTTLTISSDHTADGDNEITAAKLYWGTKKTNMPNSMDMVVDGDNWTHAVIVDLTNGVKYYCQIRPSEHADFVGCNSGIFHGTPHA